MSAYYNENDPFAAAWLRELIKADLIADGEVDERSIKAVTADDVRGFRQCHFFAGIGGWSYALRLAGWPDDRAVWTGSCPCQPWSVAGTNHGADDSRDLWPPWFRLIRERHPSAVLGEQVATDDARLWADRAAENLESVAYAFAAVVLPATCVGAPHQRDRLYFVADDSQSDTNRVASSLRRKASVRQAGEPWAFANWNGGEGSISDVDDGISSVLAKSIVRGLGNAIVPQVAQAFIEAYMDVRQGLWNGHL